MPMVRPLTKAEREREAIEREIQHASEDLLRIIGERRGRDDKTYAQMADFIGVSPDRYQRWRHKGELKGASLGRVVTVARKLGYRVIFEPINPSKNQM